MSFNTKLTDLLKTDPRFVDDEGELVIAAVQDRAWKINHDLRKQSKQLKKRFGISTSSSSGMLTSVLQFEFITRQSYRRLPFNKG